jgi:acyl-coenzyme A synthetase/AMP-(fatty) acid ligase
MTHPYEQYGLTIPEAVRRAAQRAPERVICRIGPATLTFGQLDDQANRLANALLAHGFQHGTRAAVLMPGACECLVAMVAVTRAGGVYEFLIPQYGAAELVRMLLPAPPQWLLFSAAHQAEAAAIAEAYEPQTIGLEESATASLHWPGLLAESSATPPEVIVSPDDDAMILFTSGSTGTPKALRRSHNSAMTSGVLNNRLLGLTADSVTGTMLLNHETPASLAADGGGLVIADARQPREWLATMGRERVTHMWGVPSLLQLWLAYPDWSEFDLSALQSVVVGAMSTPPEVHAQVQAKLGLPLLQIYGSMEAGVLAVNRATEGQRRSALGLPVDGKALRVLDEDGHPAGPGVIGELLAQPTDEYERGFLRGFCGDAESPWINGWLHTGDLVYADEAGYLFLVGRTYDTINVAGHKVYAPEVERALASHPAVGEAAVVGLPDAVRGEMVVAHVCLRPGQQATIADLRQHCETLLAVHKLPRRILFADSLPRTATGKVNKQLLREQPVEGQAGAPA